MESNDRHANTGLSYENVVLLCALILASVTAGYGQTGEPLTQPASGPATPSPLVLDATRFPILGTDVCSQINAAIVQMNGTTKNGVVDARGFTGPVECSSNMFPKNATGKLLLGNVVLNVSKTQVQPSQFQVEGTGWAFSNNNPTNTVIQACSAVVVNLCPNVLSNTLATTDFSLLQ
jgi:hypothetical protein